jgi:hypothetical protein
MVMQRPLFVPLVLLAACVLGGEASGAATPGEVLALDADSFAAAIKKHAFIAVEFYAPVSIASSYKTTLEKSTI